MFFIKSFAAYKEFRSVSENGTSTSFRSFCRTICAASTPIFLKSVEMVVMPSIIFRILLFIGVFMTYVKNSEATVHPNEIVLNYLNCDAECSVVFLTVRLPNNVRLSLMLKEGIWQTVLDEKGD